jgi:DNA-binding MarR family transcriptional regulator
MYDDALRPHGMRAAQLNLLVAIALVGPVRPVDLGKHFDLDKSTLSRNLSRMVDAGWIDLSKAASGRGQVAQVTDSGEAALRAAYPAWKKAQARAEALVGDELVEAIDGLDTA